MDKEKEWHVKNEKIAHEIIEKLHATSKTPVFCFDKFKPATERGKTV